MHKWTAVETVSSRWFFRVCEEKQALPVSAFCQNELGSKSNTPENGYCVFGGLLFLYLLFRLLDDACYNTGCNRTAAFTDSEAESLLHCDRSDQGDLHADVVTRHNHLYAFRQLDRSRYVRCTEIELGTIA